MRRKSKDNQRAVLQPGSTPESSFQNSPAGTRITTQGRFTQDYSTKSAGMLTRNVDSANYDVQAFTGYSSSTVPTGQWQRGQIMRMDQPTLRIPREHTAVDPTDPNSWNDFNH